MNGQRYGFHQQKRIEMITEQFERSLSCFSVCRNIIAICQYYGVKFGEREISRLQILL